MTDSHDLTTLDSPNLIRLGLTSHCLIKLDINSISPIQSSLGGISLIITDLIILV